MTARDGDDARPARTDTWRRQVAVPGTRRSRDDFKPGRRTTATRTTRTTRTPKHPSRPQCDLRGLGRDAQVAPRLWLRPRRARRPRCTRPRRGRRRRLAQAHGLKRMRRGASAGGRARTTLYPDHGGPRRRRSAVTPGRRLRERRGRQPPRTRRFRDGRGRREGGGTASVRGQTELLAGMTAATRRRAERHRGGKSPREKTTRTRRWREARSAERRLPVTRRRG